MSRHNKLCSFARPDRRKLALGKGEVVCFPLRRRINKTHLDPLIRPQGLISIVTLHPVFCLLAAFNHPVFDNRPQPLWQETPAAKYKAPQYDRLIAEDCVRSCKRQDFHPRIFVQGTFLQNGIKKIKWEDEVGFEKLCIEKVSPFSKDEDPPLSNMNIWCMFYDYGVTRVGR